MKLILLVSLAIALCGCQAVPQSTTTDAEFHRADYAAFTTQQRDTIAVARRAIRTAGKMPKGGSDDAFYRVRRSGDGVEVFVIYVTGYDASKPVFTPCVH
ncbi:MAG: hypothetical protein H7X97_05430, partial [Opitutaceae bacterium]|nr:hypothetical protein [Verrucomicrobiales bacterium]